MNYFVLIGWIFFNLNYGHGQEIDTVFLRLKISKDHEICYKRLVSFDEQSQLYFVRDYFENGQIQMEGHYSVLDKKFKEEIQCNYHTNTKEGLYKTWYYNGQIEFKGKYTHGLRDGFCEYWYVNGTKEAEEPWTKGRLNGECNYWSTDGRLQRKLTLENGLNTQPIDTSYHYILYKPENYEANPGKEWPLLIYLHGGSSRGNDLKKLYANGPPDQIYREREFPFIIAAPQCPVHLRWSTDNWFEYFYNEIVSSYRIDTNRVYLTGNSLGGSGTWYLAENYPEKFAAIAPINGFTSHMDFIHQNIERLYNMPVWAFHGKRDRVVPYEETAWMIERLKKYNQRVKFTTEPDMGHEISCMIYSGTELYDWFIKQDRPRKNKK